MWEEQDPDAVEAQEEITLPNAWSTMRNLSTTLADLIEKYGLSDVLAKLAVQVRDIKGTTTVNLAACHMADIAHALEQQSRTAQSAAMVQVFEELHGKPKVRVVVYDYTRDDNREYKFNVHIRTPEDAPLSEVLRETQQLDRAHVDLYIHQLRGRYDVLEVVELTWFPQAINQPQPDDLNSDLPDDDE